MIDALDPRWTALQALSSLGEARRGDSGWCFDADLGPLRLEAFSEGIFRLRLGECVAPDYGFLAAQADARGVEIHQSDDAWQVTYAGNTISIAADPLHLALYRDDDCVLTSTTDGHFVRPQRLPALARSEAGWFIALALQSGEPIYGLGEKWGPLNRRGQLLISRAEDSLGVNAEVSYKNCPFAWSPLGWGLLVHTPATVTHGVGHPRWSQRSYGLEVEDQALDLFFLVAPNPAALLERYTALTGRMPLPPLWSLGVWLSKAYYRDAEELLSTARTLREKQLPCDVITLDGRAWLDTETRFAFEWDASRYPEPRAVTQALHDLDLRLCCWEYPLVSVKHPLFAELAARGWLLKEANSDSPYRYRWDPEPFGQVLTPLPESGLIDLTHPDAYAWWRDRHRDLFEAGVDVIKSDFGEQVPTDCVAANGDSGRRLHNAYPLLYNRCVFEASQAYFGTGLVLGRSGWIGSQRYPLQWGGDPQADWEGLAASLRGGLSWGLSGAPCYATDIGGFYGPQPDAELFIRWTQVAVFCSHMRFHGIGPREPWAFGAEAETIVRSMLALRYRLIPYIRGVLEQAAATGLPAMRAMVLAFPDHPETWGFEAQFMFGPDLLVLPVLRPGGQVSGYLPPGDWVDFWSGECLEGGRMINLLAPLEQIPVLVRAGAVLGLGPAVSSTRELDGVDGLEALVLYGLPVHPPCIANLTLDLGRDASGTVFLDGVPATVNISGHDVEWRHDGQRLSITTINESRRSSPHEDSG